MRPRYICGTRDTAVKAVGRRKRGVRPAAAADFRKAVGAAGAGVRGVSRRIPQYRSGSRARGGVWRLRRWCA
jgi:hypothetical protein